MPAIVSESYLSQPWTLGLQAGRELVYDVLEAEDDEDVRLALAPVVPEVYLGMLLEEVHADPLGNGVWKAYARYARLEDDAEYTFDTGGGTAKVTQSLGTVASYAPAGLTPPDFQGAIGVSEDRVEGVDVPIPAFQFTETHRFTDAEVDGAYRLTLFTMTGRWNDAAFKGLASGECLFLGATGSRRAGDTKWSITFRFAGSPNVTGMTIGDITGVDKLGWDYLWVRYADFEDGFAYALVKRPVAAYVERVSLPGDFSLLNIGTT
jgi:hypothetical protein